MATWTAPAILGRVHGKMPIAPRRAVPRRRWSLAGTLEILVEPALAPRRRAGYWPRIPYANRMAMAEPMQEIATLLRDPGVEVADETQSRILALATHPASPAFGAYPVQARFAAFSLLDQLRPVMTDAES
jgi:hypothetical protein